MKNANVYKFTLARLGCDIPEEGEVDASVEDSLCGGSVIARFSKIEFLNEDGNICEIKYCTQNGLMGGLDDRFEFFSKNFSGQIRGYEYKDLYSIISRMEEDFPYEVDDEDNWAGGRGGRVNVEDENSERLKYALALSVTPYYNTLAEVNPSDEYGVTMGDESDCCEDHVFSGVFLCPDPEHLQTLIAEADEEQSIGDFIQICEEWTSDIPLVRQAYDKALLLKGQTNYTENHASLIRLAHRIIDKQAALTLITETEKLNETDFFGESKSSMYISLADFFTGSEYGFDLKKEEATRLLKLAAACVNDKQDVENIVHIAGANYLFDDRALAEELVDIIVNSATDSKLKTKRKKDCQKALSYLT